MSRSCHSGMPSMTGTTAARTTRASPAMRTWSEGTPFRQTLRERAAEEGVTLDEARLDEICRPEQYVANLGPLFDRLAALK